MINMIVLILTFLGACLIIIAVPVSIIYIISNVFSASSQIDGVKNQKPEIPEKKYKYLISYRYKHEDQWVSGKDWVVPANSLPGAKIYFLDTFPNDCSVEILTTVRVKDEI